MSFSCDAVACSHRFSAPLPYELGHAPPDVRSTGTSTGTSTSTSTGTGTGASGDRGGSSKAHFMYGFYHHFNNLHFRNWLNINHFPSPIPISSVLFVSNVFLVDMIVSSPYEYFPPQQAERGRPRRPRLQHGANYTIACAGRVLVLLHVLHAKAMRALGRPAHRNPVRTLRFEQEI